MRKLLTLLLGFMSVAMTAEVVKYPKVEVDLDKKEVRVEAALSTELMWGEPVLEFLLMRGAARGYETLFLTEADPAHVQLGLVMLGLKPFPLKSEANPTAPESLADAKPDAAGAAPCLADVFVSWHTPGGEKTVPLESLIVSRRTKKPALPMPLLFNGSYYYNDDEGKNTFAASSSGIVISMMRNPVALFNLPYFEDTPYGEDPAGFALRVDSLPSELRDVKRVNEADRNGVVRPVEHVVPKATPVKIVFRVSKATLAAAAQDPYAQAGAQ